AGIIIGFMLYCFFIIPGVIFSIVMASNRSKYRKEYQKALAEYEAVYPAKIRELNERCAALRTRAEQIILGKA
ncbi:MAG: hypothetical protein K2N47_04105, partial [Clostridia bacterium]|nr:hypothetical protein [Clostridia bacterium]